MPFGNAGTYPFSETGIATYAPRGSGVYGIYNSQKWIYVGEAKDMEARLYAHLRGESDQSACILKNSPTLYQFESCDATTRMKRETALIQEFDPVCNG
jgi:excinuclease UvrABC nuclease subunit